MLAIYKTVIIVLLYLNHVENAGKPNYFITLLG